MDDEKISHCWNCWVELTEEELEGYNGFCADCNNEAAVEDSD